MAKRDLLAFQATNSWTANIAAGTYIQDAVTANATNSINVVPVDAWKNLRGTIEAIAVYATTGSAKSMNIVFASGAAGDTTGAVSNKIIDHYALTGGDFLTLQNTTIKSAHINGLAIPYIDADVTKTFHVGLQAVSALTIADPGNFVVRWWWRPDAGVS